MTSTHNTFNKIVLVSLLISTGITFSAVSTMNSAKPTANSSGKQTVDITLANSYLENKMRRDVNRLSLGHKQFDRHFLSKTLTNSNLK